MMSRDEMAELRSWEVEEALEQCQRKLAAAYAALYVAANAWRPSLAGYPAGFHAVHSVAIGDAKRYVEVELGVWP